MSFRLIFFVFLRVFRNIEYEKVYLNNDHYVIGGYRFVFLQV